MTTYGPHTIEFYTDTNGREPVREWARDLSPFKRRALGVAIKYVLEVHGQDVCSSEWGTNLKQGLFEFRIRRNASETLHLTDQVDDSDREESGEQEKVLLRVFCHAHGNRIVLLLGGYDKGKDSSTKRQQREIETARRRLREFRSKKAS